jgi:large subunit ribosomal protein L7e
MLIRSSLTTVWDRKLIPPSQSQKEKRGVIFKRAEKYVKEYRDQEREKIRLARLAKQDGSFYIPAEEKLVFVVRIKG